MRTSIRCAIELPPSHPRRTYEGSEETASAGEALRHLRASLHVAEEVGTGVGRSEVLQRPLPKHEGEKAGGRLDRPRGKLDADQPLVAIALSALSRIHAVETGDRFTRRRGGRGEGTSEWKADWSPEGERLPALKCSRLPLLSALSAAPREFITAWIRLRAIREVVLGWRARRAWPLRFLRAGRIWTADPSGDSGPGLHPSAVFVGLTAGRGGTHGLSWILCATPPGSMGSWDRQSGGRSTAGYHPGRLRRPGQPAKEQGSGERRGRGPAGSGLSRGEIPVADRAFGEGGDLAG